MEKNKHSEIYFLFLGILSIWLILEMYANTWSGLNYLGLTSKIFDWIIQKIPGIFHSSFKIRLIVGCVVVINCAALRLVEKKTPISKIFIIGGIGLLLFVGAVLFISFKISPNWIIPVLISYVLLSVVGFFLLSMAGSRIAAYLSRNQIENDVEADGFMQNTKLMVNQYSINLPMEFSYHKRKYKGFVNVINPFRATAVFGTPGSGKSYAIIEPFHKQWIQKIYKEKNFIPTMLVYDYKFPSLARNIYNYYATAVKKYTGDKQVPTLCNINFTFPSLSYRCNAFKYISSTAGAGEVAEVIYTSLNRDSAQRQGEFFIESAKNLLTLLIWFLKIYEEGKYCSFPHTLVILSRSEKEIFPILSLYSVFYKELDQMFAPFKGAYDSNALEQLQGQIGSVRIGLNKQVNENIFFVMTEDEENPKRNVELDVNDKDNPKIFIFGNDGGENENPEIKDKKDTIFAAALSVYFSCALPLINKQKKNPCMLSLDEMPTIYIKGIDKLIATARSNKVAVLIGLQDWSQGVRDYQDKIWAAIQNTIGNVFSGAVKGEGAKKLSEAFGEKKIQKESKTINDNGGGSTSISESNEKKIPQSTIENLSQGTFVGTITDNFDQKMDKKEFMCQFIVENDTSQKVEIPSLYSEEEKEELPYRIKANARKVDADIDSIVMETHDLVKKYEKLREFMKEFTGEVQTFEKQGSKKTNVSITKQRALSAFHVDDLPAQDRLCTFFTLIYFISQRINVPEFQYARSDKATLRGKCRVLDIPYSENDTDEKIIDKMNAKAWLTKANILLKNLCPSTLDYNEFSDIMHRYFSDNKKTKMRADKVFEALNAFKTNTQENNISEFINPNEPDFF